MKRDPPPQGAYSWDIATLPTSIIASHRKAEVARIATKERRCESLSLVVKGLLSNLLLWLTVHYADLQRK